MGFVSPVEFPICGAAHDAKRLLTVCEKCGQMLAVRYDLARVAASLTKPALRQRAAGMYRLRELTLVLPLCESCARRRPARYSLPAAAASLTKPALRQRAAGMYRFRELTPL